MRPYVQKHLDDHITVFDYRSSQIHCVAFEILVHKFCLFTSKILVTLENVTATRLAAILQFYITCSVKNTGKPTLQRRPWIQKIKT